MITSITQRIAQELFVHPNQVQAAVDLLDGGATVPFISRYRKEATGSLDDTQMRTLEERLRYLRELEERRSAILKSVAEQGKLSAELEKELLGADSKVRLEDLYLPYKPKRRTKAMIAREAGLEPLAEVLLADPMRVPEEAALAYVDADKGVADVKAALEGARHILMEKFSEDAELLGKLRDYLWDNGVLKSTLVAGKEIEGAKFRDYFDSREPLKAIPSHRALAQLRGRNEGFLQLALVLEEDEQAQGRAAPPNRCEQMIARRFLVKPPLAQTGEGGRPADKWLNETVRWAWRVKIFLHLDLELTSRLREAAEAEAIRVFARNLHDLLLAAPAGPRTTIGLDPGLRSGVKVAVVDTTGKLVDFSTIYPHEPKREWEKSVAVIAALATKHRAELISIGNGTASRETDKLANEVIKRHPDLKLQKLVVSEAGASVYSASELAAREFPDVDVTIRGAVSIARRLQDPLAELVKIDPKSIGVGQYQHDVNQYDLARGLDAVVEDCVNKVGVDVNTASAPLLARISGLNATLAGNIVDYRDQYGAFSSRSALKKVPRLGDKTFEQAAGFLRIMNGDNPLDASAVHPESYPLVERIVARLKVGIKGLIGDSNTLRRLAPTEFTDEKFGLPTVKDILSELEKPGRDPRPEFKTATFQEGVEELKDLQPGMILEGVVTNVANFGAFVDIGVHQDGLVHISALAQKFVKDPHSIVKAGDVVRVKVLEIDPIRRRIALTMRLSDDTAPAASTLRNEPSRKPQAKREPAPQVGGAMAAAMAKLRKGG
ncbi:RNA binding S1 domain protein [Sulfuricella denitrificans skB26]|uniref:RNA binding S1 domain protein n=1 Tax=Sulfuricella denitrificans (strain DSM 22764 / NBRC 105220 / skB26) TaxID=1163617 RepID=S6AG06_SULDS|nr:Tex family protein [Sulfuricella denitrificans]BAN34891.1 RNA binding S1 domain protein [Sulfuricella denitrificans skB26]